MSLDFSDRISTVKPSAIREILKFSSKPGVISFAAGNPASDSFNIPIIKEIIDNIFKEDPVGALQYSISEGVTPFREHLKEMVAKKYGISCENNNLLVVSGAQQGIELATKALVNEGDTVLCENPTFVAAINTFKTYNATVVGVDVEEDGISIEKLEAALKAHPNTKLIYLIPNFQNPTGITMSLEKRKAVYKLALKYHTRILEDNPYGDLRFRGEEVPSIKSFDTENIVIYVGSFSKVFSSGMRVGYLICENELASKIVVAKQVSDVHTNVLAQKICHRFITEYNFEEYIEGLRKIYKEKCDIMVSSIEKYFSKDITFTKPDGGLFIWCTLPHGIDSTQFCKRATEEYNVAIVPGNAFCVDSNAPSNCFRMNYSSPSVEDIQKGIELLGRLTKEI